MSESKSNFQALQQSSYLGGGNATYLEALYERYLEDPKSVDAFWQHYFDSLSQQPGADVSYDNVRDYFRNLATAPIRPVREQISGTEIEHERKQVQVTKLINAYRFYGHYQAKLDPLNLEKPLEIPVLKISHYGLSQELNSQFIVNGFFSMGMSSLREICEILNRTYCGTMGFEYKHIPDQAQVDWIQQRIESIQAQPHFNKDKKIQILHQLIQAEGLERYLGVKYVGQTRFSIEGNEAMMPLLQEVIERCSSHQGKEILIGMGHRGRLNVLVNAFGKSPQDLFQEFEGKHQQGAGSGDVKYHMGFSCDVKTAFGAVHLVLAFNPSHLEIIDPVVEGSARCRQDFGNDTQQKEVVPVLLHGDAAFAGQGVVMETFSLSQAHGYKTGGTIHIVVNNQIGFTTSDRYDARSSWYCTDIAKMVDAPIFHVNGNDPEAVIFAGQLAVDFRMMFKKDVVIDLIGYRRHGHNEGDEPSATQPGMYRKIKQLASVRTLYAEKLIAEKIITQNEIDEFSNQYRQKLDKGQTIVPIINGKGHDQFAVDWKPFLDQEWTAPAKTGFPLAKLRALAQKIETLPEKFELQPQVGKMIEDRRKMTAGELPINWGYAENLAYAALLSEGYPIRISGEDSQRGTFAHRHAVLHHYSEDTRYVPLQHISADQGTFTVIDSVLSEEAVLGFEYGYASTNPNALVIWEAQYGDFVNGAQVVIDQFISSGEQKWGRLCGLVMYLPHGYEGAGPEHSSGRLERFLQACAEHNMQVCVPTTPAQIFHLIRRQILRPYRKPLIVMTPKSLLRHKVASSTFEELAKGEFKVVIPEVDQLAADKVKRIILCSGKVYYDLLEQRRSNKANIAIIRIEQLYPFPEEQLVKELANYKSAQEIIWCQEEPKNQGAWYSICHHLLACLGKGQTLNYVGRAASASPATGSKMLHAEQQKKLVQEALS